MLIQGPHGIETQDKIFIHVESGETGIVTNGRAVIWDRTDNTASLGETRGIRVIYSTGAVMTGVAGITEETVPGTPIGKRGRAFLVQTFGWYPDPFGFSTVTGNDGELILVTAVAGSGLVDAATMAAAANPAAGFGVWLQAPPGGSILINSRNANGSRSYTTSYGVMLRCM